MSLLVFDVADAIDEKRIVQKPTSFYRLLSGCIPRWHCVGPMNWLVETLASFTRGGNSGEGRGHGRPAWNEATGTPVISCSSNVGF